MSGGPENESGETPTPANAPVAKDPGAGRDPGPDPTPDGSPPRATRDDSGDAPGGLAIADISVNRPVFATMMSLALIFVGALSYTRLGVDLLPDVERPQVTVFTALPGAGPEEIESAISQPIEEQLNTIAGIEEMRSVNREGFSFVIITFGLERPIDEAVQDVRDKLARVVRALPEGTTAPTISTFDADSQPILAVALAGPQSLREVTEFAETRVKDVIGTAPGVGAVTIEGGARRSINVVVDAQRMAGLGLTVDDVKGAIQRQNVEIPGGRVTRNAREDVLRTIARVNDPRELEELVVATTPEGAPVLVRDVAAIEDGSAEIRGASRLNGQSAVTLSVQKLAGANIVSTADGVKQRLRSLEGTLPAGMQLLVLRDASRFVEESVAEARFHLVGGALLAALAVLLFMGSWRSTIIAAVAIPASVIATFGAMKLFGFTLNNITLLALTLAVGVVIDDAIVVVENIHRHVDEKGKNPIRAAKDGTREIALAISATTLSLVVIFLPVAFMTGQIGRLFHSYGVTVTAAILVSLFVAVTLTPMLASRVLKPTQGPPRGLARMSHRLTGFLDDHYERLVAWSLDHRLIVVGISVVCMLSAIPLYLLSPSDLIPEDDQSEFEVSIELPTGTSFAAADGVIQEIEAHVQRLPHVRDVLVSVGDARGTGSATRASIYVGLVPIEDRALSQQDVMARARTIFQRYPDLRATIRSLNTAGIGGPGYGGKVRLAVRGPDLEKLEEILHTLMREMRSDPLLVDVFSPSADKLPELRVIPDRRKAADLGVEPMTIAETLRVLVGGDVISSYREGDERYDIWMRARLDDRNSLEAVGKIPLRTRTGGVIPLENVATLGEASGPTLILRLNGLRQVFVSSNPAPGTPLGTAVEHINAAIERANIPPGYDTVFMGDVQTLEETRREFLIALLLSLVFVYMVLAAQFESFLHPVTILLALPLTAPFALLSLRLLGESINVYSIFGMFMLFGIVKKNGILQVDTTNQLLAKGRPLRAAIIEANRLRLRPILMTTLTLIAAMAPMTIAQGPGAASRAALARVIVGGQGLSLIITLLIVPVAYSLFHELTKRERPIQTPAE
jgi:hydrophobic/amphiphilic exporter-1 (mainly G- bacteria), HAE1 family